MTHHSKHITLIPHGGLANRMKAIAAGLRLAEAVDSQLHIIWFANKDLNAKFSDLFMPIDSSRVTVTEGTRCTALRLGRPRLGNAWVPAFCRLKGHSRFMNVKTVTQHMDEGDFDFTAWARGHNVWMATCVYFWGEPIPDELIDRIIRSRNFMAAYGCLRQVSFGLLDMAYYTQKDEFSQDIMRFEKEAWKDAIVMPQMPDTCMTVQFSHIMAGGYAAGYYSYKWAEVLDADAFSVFKKNGIFDHKTAQSFRDNILSKGGTEHPMTLYKRFRGQEPTIDALLERNGIKRQAR